MDDPEAREWFMTLKAALLQYTSVLHLDTSVVAGENEWGSIKQMGRVSIHYCLMPM